MIFKNHNKKFFLMFLYNIKTLKIYFKINFKNLILKI